jgi:hypothetical protein
VDTTCLSSNRNVAIISDKSCGNGIVEDDEECDCGGEDGCRGNPCCDPKTCKWTAGSVCDDSNDDCCAGCQYKPKGEICRISNGPCDPEEVCSGTEAQCPEDVVKPDGTNCANGLKCASGICTSRDEQCRTVMGTFDRSNATSSCSDQGCSITCRAPEFGPGVCYDVKQNYLDGTVCNGDGKCKAGRCDGSTVLGSVKSWIEQVSCPVIQNGISSLTNSRTKQLLLVLHQQSAVSLCSLLRFAATDVAASPSERAQRGLRTLSQSAQDLMDLALADATSLQLRRLRLRL